MKIDVLTIDNKKSSVIDLDNSVFVLKSELIFCIEWLIGS